MKQGLLSRKTLLGVGIILICAIAGLLIATLQTKKPLTPIASPDITPPYSTHRTIGTSVEGRGIESWFFGSGDTKLLFVGGVHGGYEWNSVLLAYEFIDYFTEHHEAIPDTIQIAIIPALNPDGVYAVTGKEGKFGAQEVTQNITAQENARFNAHKVDLNRNFGCKWKPTSTWRSRTVSAGTAAFSEPEAAALRDFIQDFKPKAAIFWHSQSNAVYASECEEGILPRTLTLMDVYAQAATYPAIKTFDAYEISGDAEGWLASIGIPAITVELKTHETIEWDKNLSGVQALLNHFKK